jgi:hypothetical protein
VKVSDLLQEWEAPVRYHAAPVRDGYSALAISSLGGMYVVKYDGKYMDHTPKPITDAIQQLTSYLTSNYPELKLPLKYFTHDNDNNIDVGDATGEWMDAELLQLSYK